MNTRPDLVDLKKLRELVANLKLGDEQRNECVSARWVTYVEGWNSRANKAKWKYLALRRAVVIFGASIPALVGLRELEFLAEYDGQFAIALIFASFIIAISAGIESLSNYGDIWREKRNAVELLKSEGFHFLQLTGVYKEFETHADAYQTFMENVERLIVNEIKDYIVAVSQKPDQQPKAT